MFWDRIAGLYDLFEDIYNRAVYRETGRRAAAFIPAGAEVLECACGTGAITVHLAPVCRSLTATDFSAGMLARAEKKLRGFGNVTFARADITALPYPDDAFDAVVAGNVIHLLPAPEKAMAELTRVCRDGGRLILPTYINDSAADSRLAVRFLELLGARFSRQFDEASYRAFLERMGCRDVTYTVVPGRMACEIAVVPVRKENPRR